MSIQKAYNDWAEQYDSNNNKTRDLEALSLRETLSNISFDNCLEIGCGTGKNTEWLAQRALVTAVDFSEEMLRKAKEKTIAGNPSFKQADITKEWKFTQDDFDLISFSLVLEHIERLDHIFLETAKVLKTGGHIYIGELHPFKQYSGSKAKFDTAEGEHVVSCYTHHISDFIHAAKAHKISLIDVKEYFDNNDKNGPPRILTILFRKM